MTKEELDAILKKNMEESIKRYNKRLQAGQIDYKEYQRLCDWEKRNYESGGVLYAEKIAKALTPNPFWKWNT